MPKPTLLLKITTYKEKGDTRFELNMPDIDMQATANPAPVADLADIKVVNETTQDIHLYFPASHSPTDPAEINVDALQEGNLTWKATVALARYTYTVAVKATLAAKGTQGGGKGVQPANGTIDVEVMN